MASSVWRASRLVIVLGVVIALGWWLWPRAVPVDVATAAFGPLQVTIDDDGEARVRDRYVVSAPIAGRLTRVTLRAGDAVAPGSVVARLELLPIDERARSQAQGRLEAARDAERAATSLVTQARAALTQARRDLDRAESLAQGRIASAEAREKAELAVQLHSKELEAADFRAQAAAHDVEAALAALIATSTGTNGVSPVLEIRSPVGGRVLRVPEASARVVAAGEPLLEIGDPTTLEIAVDLLSSEAAKVGPGNLMLIEDWGGERPLRARLRVVEPSAFTKVSALGIEEQRVNVIGDLIESAPSLGDRYRVRVRVVTWEAERVLKVPWSALFRAGDDWQVFVLVGGRARARTVAIGHQGAFETEVLSGLVEGDLVVRHPTDQIRDGLRVAARMMGRGV
jgi:HlyD family secretion protein